jgi:hypothetical protein
MVRLSVKQAESKNFYIKLHRRLKIRFLKNSNISDAHRIYFAGYFSKLINFFHFQLRKYSVYIK